MKRFLLYLFFAIALVLPGNAAENLRDVTFAAADFSASMGPITKQAADASGDFNVTVTIAKGNGSDPKYYSAGHVRWYGANTLTVTAAGDRKISQIEITAESGNPVSDKVTVNSGEMVNTGTVGKWDGNAASVVFTNGVSNTKHVRISQIKVYYDYGTSTPASEIYWTDYTGYVDGHPRKLTSATVEVGDVPNLYAYDKATYTSPANATYSSSNQSVAVIDEEGNISTLSAGTTNLIVTSGSASATCELTVTGTATADPVITFSHPDGEYAYGTEMSFTVANATEDNIIYDIENADITVTNVGTTYSFKLTDNVSITVLAEGEDGSEATGERTYMVLDPSAPVFAPVTGGNTVSVSADNSTEIWVAEYYIDGELGEYQLYSAPLSVDKMHRRFIAYSKTPLAQSATTEYFAPLPKASKAEGATSVKYVLVENLSDLQDGDRIMVYTHATTNKNPTGYFKALGAVSGKNFAAVDVPTNTISEDYKTISELPAGAKLLTLEATGEANSYYLNYGTVESPEYYYPGNKTITKGQTAVVFSFDNASGRQSDGLPEMKMKSGSYWLQFNWNGVYFSGYSSDQKPVRVYKEVVDGPVEPAKPDYTVAFHHTEFKKNSKSAPEKMTSKDFETRIEMDTDGTADENGEYVYTVIPTNVSGNFEFEVEGQRLTGHQDEAKVSGNDKPSYVYVENSLDGEKKFRLVRVESDNAVEMSTNPDHYNGHLYLYEAPTIKVGLKPFYGINMNLYSTKTTGVESIMIDNAGDGQTRMFNLNGVEVPQGVVPAPGLYIRRTGGTATKVVIR